MDQGIKSMGEMSNARSDRWFATIEGLPGIDLKLVDFTLPMISIGETDLGGPTYHRVKVPGDRLEYDEVQLNFLVDKAYGNYFTIFRWLKKNVTSPLHETRDITVHLLDNQGQPQGINITYINAWPIMLAPIALDSGGDTTDIQAALSLKYDDIVVEEQGIELASDDKSNSH